MLHTISERFASRFARHGIISHDSIDVYVYGLELIFSFFASTSVILLIGTILSKIIETLIFLSVFVVLRSFTGGYHAKTYLRCAIVTYSTYLSVIICSSYIVVLRTAYVIGMLMALLIIAILSPIENPNKTIHPRKKIRHKITSILITISFSVLGYILELNNKAIMSVVFFSIIADVILMIPNIIKKGELYGKLFRKGPC